MVMGWEAWGEVPSAVAQETAKDVMYDWPAGTSLMRAAAFFTAAMLTVVPVGSAPAGTETSALAPPALSDKAVGPAATVAETGAA
jgi:hypothetical protein